MDSSIKVVISKIWKRYKSFSDIKKNRRSLPRCTHNLDESKVAAVGHFPIYVGPEKDRFVIKTEQVNHPLFKNLLEQAECEYGYDNKGPLMLPCQVDYFVQVLMEMDYCNEEIGQEKGCSSVARTQASYHLHILPRVTSLAG